MKQFNLGVPKEHTRACFYVWTTFNADAGIRSSSLPLRAAARRYHPLFNRLSYSATSHNVEVNVYEAIQS